MLMDKQSYILEHILYVVCEEDNSVDFVASLEVRVPRSLARLT